MAVEKQARLDTKHGFLKQIIKNQIDRDEYDKEVKAQQQQQRRQRNQAWKRPDQNIYSPPKRNTNSLMEEKVPLEVDQEEEAKELLEIEFVNQRQELTTDMMYKGDNPRQVAVAIGRKEGLPPTFIQALTEFITEELNGLETGT